jgi:ArsR family transcriptional regulator
MIEILKALADNTRLLILSEVIKNDMNVSEVQANLNLTFSNVSRHLNILKRAGIIESYKKAQWTYYKISTKFKTENIELYNYLINKAR